MPTPRMLSRTASARSDLTSLSAVISIGVSRPALCASSTAFRRSRSTLAGTKLPRRPVGTAMDHQAHNVSPVFGGTLTRYRLLHSMALATELEHGALSDVFGKGILRC